MKTMKLFGVRRRIKHWIEYGDGSVWFMTEDGIAGWKWANHKRGLSTE